MRWALVVVAGCTSGPGVTTRPIIAGTPAPDDVAVVAVAHRAVQCEPESLPLECTGTLIAPRVVLTAAHCLAGGPANALAISFAAVYAGGTVPVIGGRAHPAFDPATHANDIAALILAGDAPVAPIALRTTALPDLTGTDVRLVGYGITTGTGTDVGTRATGTARVTAVGADDVMMAPDPAMSCHGDSGGPVLAGTELIGVTSYGDPACATLGVAIRVDRQLAFIQPILDEAAAPPARRAFDPAEPLCRETCATDADCPDETACFEARCVYRGLPAGELGAPCTTGGACACVAIPGDTCREYHPCEVEPGAACAPIADDPGCGCRSSRDGGWILAILGLYGSGRSGAKKRSKRASSSPVAAR